jgi:PAS domain S-box-containing protein
VNTFVNLDERDSTIGLSPIEFYEFVYNDLPHGVVVVKNDTVFYTNKAFAELVGYPLEEIRNWSTENLFRLLLTHQEDIRKLYDKGGDPERNGMIYSYQIITGSGKTKHIEMIPVRFAIHADEFYHAMLFDVSDRIRANQEIKENEERFRRTFDSIPEPAYLWEQNEQGAIILKMANKRVVDMTDGIVNQHLGKEPNSLFVDNPEFSEYIRMTLETGQNIRTETTISHPRMPQAATVIVNCVKPAENLVLMINTDITKEREAQEIAKRSEQEKAVILDSMRDHLIYYETKDLAMSWTNKAAAESLNLTPAELIGKRCYNLWQETSEPCNGCPVLEAWNTGLPKVREMKTPDKRIWLVKGLPIKNMAEHVIGVVEVTREITAEKEAESATQEAKNRAELYLDLLSHDLNNIHQGVIIGLQLALQDDLLSEHLKSVLQTSLEQVNRGVNLIRNVQKFATILDSPAHLVPMELVPIFESGLKIVRNSYPLRHLIVNLDISDENVVIDADEFLIDAIFNLLYNTMKHSTDEIVTIDVKIGEIQD